MQQEKIQSDLIMLFKEGVSSVNPRKLIHDSVKIETREEIDYLVVNGKYYDLLMDVFVVGFGKAVLGMARALEEYLQPYFRNGIIIIPKGTLDDHPELNLSISSETVSTMLLFECGENNLPDMDSEYATQQLVTLVSGLNKNTILIVLISGGGSALLTLPVPGISLTDKINVIKMLTSAGSDILDLNCVRKKLSLVKGGKLAHIAYPAQVISLIISDVVGDPIATIASGPTCSNPDSPNQAWEVIEKYNLQSQLSENVIAALASTDDVYSPNDFDHVNNIIIGNNAIALRAIDDKAKSMGYNSLVVSDKIEGIAQNLSFKYATLVTNICKLFLFNLDVEEFNTEFEMFRSECVISIQSTDLVNAIIASSKDSKSPLCLILGGETTVKITGSGVGGRNQELALAFGIEMDKKKETNPVLDRFEVVLLSAGTDGIDGPTDVAGAFSSTRLVDQAKSEGIDPSLYLKNNDSYTFFSMFRDGANFLKTGHTGTNVMDVHLIVIKRK